MIFGKLYLFYHLVYRLRGLLHSSLSLNISASSPNPNNISRFGCSMTRRYLEYLFVFVVGL